MSSHSFISPERFCSNQTMPRRHTHSPHQKCSAQITPCCHTHSSHQNGSAQIKPHHLYVFISLEQHCSNHTLSPHLFISPKLYWSIHTMSSQTFISPEWLPYCSDHTMSSSSFVSPDRRCATQLTPDYPHSSRQNRVVPDWNHILDTLIGYLTRWMLYHTVIPPWSQSLVTSEDRCTIPWFHPDHTHW